VERLKIGVWSGFNYPGDGARVGLWKAAQKVFAQEGIHFSVFVGGLVDRKELEVRLKAKLAFARMLKRLRAKRKLTEGEQEFLGKYAKVADMTDAEVREQFYDEVSAYLVKHFPNLGVKTYLVTSPAYDGEMGKQIAHRLAEARDDISHSSAKKLLRIKQFGGKKRLGVYTSEKMPPFRSKYFDTPIMRVLEDQWKSSSRAMGDLNIVGPFGSSVFNPGAARDVKRPYASVPLLCKPGEVRTSENQFGIRVLEVYSSNLKEALVTTYSFKDLVSQEGQFVQPPLRSTDIQKAVVAAIGENGSMTIGQLEEATGKNRDLVVKEVESLCAKKRTKHWPGLAFDEAQKEYGFQKEWFQRRLRYPLPKEGKLMDEVFLAFGCLHAMCKWSDMLWFRDEVPKYCIEHNVQYLIGAGDFIEGLKHDLINNGEVASRPGGPSNYTYQEKVAAYLVAMPMLQVFDHRFKGYLQSVKGKEVSQEELSREVKKALINFIFRPGNHCGWVKPLGFDSLATFTPELRTMLQNGIGARLSGAGLILDSETLRVLVKDKTVNVTKEDSYLLPSGLRLNVYHPEMGNTTTPSIRPQQVLGFSPNQLVFSANFHSAESVEEWNFDLGQRACLQVGTIKTRSGFEDGKLKIVDFGVGLLKVSSLLNKQNEPRIFKTQTGFFGIPKNPENLQADNEKLIREYEAYQQKYR
jgi:hypothetical protein